MAKRPYRPPFQVTPKALRLIADLMRLVGRYEGLLSPTPQPKLRRHNQIRTIVGSLAIEGNTLSFDQATAILDHKRVVGPKKDIVEVANAISVYEQASRFHPDRASDLLRAHDRLMKGLSSDAGQFRSKNVGVFHGKQVRHLPPPHAQVPRLVSQLFRFLKSADEVEPLVLSAVVHYELEFIHPFTDGNGRMGRLWQHVILSHFHPVFAYVPFESAVHERQREYYKVLAACDKAGDSTQFIEFSLATLRDSLEAFLRDLRPAADTPQSRLDKARQHFGKREFSRRDYLQHFKQLSTASASRDLRDGVVAKRLTKTGARALTRYRFR